MYISTFDIFKVGIGPSSSHTMGPMKAADAFIKSLITAQTLEQVARVTVDLYGSLAFTGKGHGTDKAVVMGLLGERPDLIDPDTIPAKRHTIEETGTLLLGGIHAISFREAEHILFHYNETLPRHTNGMRFTAYNARGEVLFSEIYYSVGGGFIVTDAQFDHPPPEAKPIPFPFETAETLLSLCRTHHMTISQLMLANEKVYRDETEINANLLRIAEVMDASLDKGCSTEGILPGGLNVRRRAAALYKKLIAEQSTHKMNWLNAYAMAVNEENAAGGRIVTAPTNGAAGIVPAVLRYYKEFCTASTEGVIDFLLTASAIAILYKLRASISGAEVGCQGEVGVACSMAAGALTAALGGTLAQIECAAEIGMEHNLGLPCDPPKGLVQIPCIERNAMGAVKAVNAASLALAEDGVHNVSLDAVIKTMNEIGSNMMTIYKETSLGGLAVNVSEC